MHEHGSVRAPTPLRAVGHACNFSSRAALFLMGEPGERDGAE